MSSEGRKLGPIDFRTSADRYRHWRLEVAGSVSRVTLDVAPEGGLSDEYQLKLNSYDLSVDIELYDITQRLRFEHPEVRAVVLTGGPDRIFCAGANIQMLAGSTHEHKVNFCKFTNETRLGIEDATEVSHQTWIAAVNGTAAGGGYELALACEEIILVDDRSSVVSLPELPLLAVLPGTGGLSRVIDKRHVRRDRADLFATRAEGIKGEQARAWGLVDVIAAPSIFEETVRKRALEAVARSDRPGGAGVTLSPLSRQVDGPKISYSSLDIELDRNLSVAHFRIRGPSHDEPSSASQLLEKGDSAWILRLCREIDDALLHLRFNEAEIGTWVFHSSGDPSAVVAVEDALDSHMGHWLVREIRAYWKRTFKRLDTSARTVVALVEPGSCFAGTLAEFVLAADRSLIFEGSPGEGIDPPPCLTLTSANQTQFPMGNGLSRLQARYWGHDDDLQTVVELTGKPLSSEECASLGLVTFAFDELDWDDEVRMTLEERSSFSPDALTGMEANLRFVGPETMESKIFGRLSTWQNWIFLRPNASGPDGALRRYGTGSRPTYDRKRV